MELEGIVDFQSANSVNDIHYPKTVGILNPKTTPNMMSTKDTNLSDILFSSATSFNYIPPNIIALYYI